MTHAVRAQAPLELAESPASPGRQSAEGMDEGGERDLQHAQQATKWTEMFLKSSLRTSQ